MAKVKQLKPITPQAKDEKRIEKDIVTFFFESIYSEILLTIKEQSKIYFNSSSILINAIRAGRIQFANNTFTGSFNAKISKELQKIGATFDRRIGGYRIDKKKLSADVISTIAQTKVSFEQINKSVVSKIDDIISSFDSKLKDLSFVGSYTKTINNIDKLFTKSVDKVVGVVPQLTEAGKEKIAKEYSDNLSLYVKNFTDEELPKLRSLVEQNFVSGYRTDSLTSILQKRFNVSKNKAKFLASQETSILNTKFTQARYEEVGLNEYKWSTSKDSRVRQSHKDLNNKIFSWDNPPITNPDTGERNHPGEEYGCRCVPIPIVR